MSVLKGAITPNILLQIKILLFVRRHSYKATRWEKKHILAIHVFKAQSWFIHISSWFKYKDEMWMI